MYQSWIREHEERLYSTVGSIVVGGWVFDIAGGPPNMHIQMYFTLSGWSVALKVTDISNFR